MKLLILLCVQFLSVAIAQENVDLTCDFSLTARGYTCTLPTVDLRQAFGVNIIPGIHQQNRTNAGVVALSLLQSNVNFFPKQMFEIFPNLQHISFVGANLPVLEVNVFTNQNQVLYLELYNNGIRVLEPRVFYGMWWLETLNLQSNNIEALPQGVFSGLFALQSVNLLFNSITRLESNLFAQNENLRSIHFQINRINFIHPNLFDNTPLIQTINLETNVCINQNFVDIRNGDLTNILPQLSRCFGVSPVTCLFTDNTAVQGNSSAAYTCVIANTTLARDHGAASIGGTHVAGMNNQNVFNLRIVSSEMPLIVTEIFTTFRNLRALEITSGGLEVIHLNDFENADQLESIFMEFNEVKVLQGGVFMNLPRLQTLSLSRNEIERIDGNAFTGLESLRSLQLQDNQITRLSRNTLNAMTELRDLNLGRNYLTRISSLLFFHNRNLESIDLNANQISSIEEDFLDHLPSLAALNLINNRCVNGLYDSDRNRINSELQHCYQEYRSLPNDASRKVIMEIVGEVGLTDDEGRRIIEL